MSRKQHIVSQVLKLIEQMDENERSIVKDFLRTPRQRPKSSSPASSVARRSSSRKQSAGGQDQSTKTEQGGASDAAKVASIGGD